MKNSFYKFPKQPIIDWSSFNISKNSDVKSIENLKYVEYTTSGRAAIYQALLQLNLPAGTTVLVPSYHCPTMVAPIILANLKVSFYSIDSKGLPQLKLINKEIITISKVILVSHYFGIANSLHEVRQWCDDHSIFLIEDCAHCFYGEAGERSIGAWGDYSTASLSKFFPVIEGGIVASNTNSIKSINLKTAKISDELKSWINIFEISIKNYGFVGLNNIFRLIFKARFKFANKSNNVNADLTNIGQWIRYCDMGRINNKILFSSFFISKIIQNNLIIKKRKENYLHYEKIFLSVSGARPLIKRDASKNEIVAPYVFPLWVDDATRVYQALKELKIPVYRWDMVWPNMPKVTADMGPLWSKHVLQLLCHQNLNEKQIYSISNAIIKLIQN